MDLIRFGSSNENNFQELARKHGYVKARQMVKQATIRLQQEKINREESSVNNSKQPLRLKESIRLGNTFGRTGGSSVVESVVNASRDALVTTAANSALKSGSAGVGVPLQRKIVASTNDEKQIFVDSLRQSIRSQDGEFIIPNRDIHFLPHGLGDTLYMQMGFVRKVSAGRNNLRSILSAQTPQLSLYHLHYVREINLTLNKIGKLPSDLGVLQSLEVLDLSHNMLSELPDSISTLSKLKDLNLTGNSFSGLPKAFGFLHSLEKLGLANNLLSTVPYPVTRVRSLRRIDLSRNVITQLLILPSLSKAEDMWMTVIDKRTGSNVYMNILTKERVRRIEYYSGRGIHRATYLHEFQPPDAEEEYRKRKFWLSLCQVHEWEPADDPSSGLTYYKNNVSGRTSWNIPPSIDSIGTMDMLAELIVTHNSIKSLPQSFVSMKQLRKINLSHNRVFALPERFGDLKLLEDVDFSSNELRILPVSFCDLSLLKKLNLKDNQLLRLPERLGLLPSLVRLDVAANHLKQVPFTLGYCKTLEYFAAYENPLVDPPVEEFSKSLDSLKWYLRTRFLIEKNGKPPMMQYHQIGIGDEVTILKPEFNEIVQQMIDVTFKDGMLNLQLMGLKEIPHSVLKIGSKLKKLKLDFNTQLRFPRGFPKEFKSLMLLSMRSCKLPELPSHAHRMKHLMTLNLEENNFEILPDELCELVNLTHLDLSKNKIYSLPIGFEGLKQLKTLNLEANCIESLPDGVGQMSELRSLNLGKNRMVDFPDAICDLSGLKVLNMERNNLLNVPKRIFQLTVVELRIGHNRIEELPEDMFSSALGQSVKVFSCCENNILELPTSLGYVDSGGLLEADFNPLISPPPMLLSEGLAVLQNYFRIREKRKSKIEELLGDEDFDYVASAATPIAAEVLEDGTGFLTPADLAEFDQAIHEYINGEFYRCPASAEEIVASVATLRDERETEMYLLILYTFLDIVKKIVEDPKQRKLFSEATIFQSTRPWGRKGEPAFVWCISLHALLRNTAPNNFHAEGRPSIFSLIKAALPTMIFPFTVDLLKDAIRLYVSPYGQIADTEQITFPQCDCVDEKRGKPKRHNPCAKAAVVIAKSVYTDEEANRREVEEDEYLVRFEEIEEEVRIWLQTEDGIKGREKECKRRKAVLKEDIMLREELVLSQQVKIKRNTEALRKINLRKNSFEAGEAFENHGYHNMSEALKAIAKEEAELAKHTERLELLQAMVSKLKEEYGQDITVFRAIVSNDLVQKYCVECYQRTIEGNRRFAAQNRLHRYWDGDDGSAYEAWKRTHRYLVQDENGPHVPAQISTPRPTTPPAVADRGKTDSESASKELPPEYNWEYTDNMKRYKLNLYERYRLKQKSLLGLLS